MFVEAIKRGFQNYFTFSTRSPRWEYWYWALFAVIVTIVAALVDRVALGIDPGEGDLSPVQTVVGLAMFIPGIAIGIRRLHDLDRTGWWLLITLTGVGLILLIIWACMKGTTGSNRFGADPLAATS